MLLKQCAPQYLVKLNAMVKEPLKERPSRIRSTPSFIDNTAITPLGNQSFFMHSNCSLRYVCRVTVSSTLTQSSTATLLQLRNCPLP